MEQNAMTIKLSFKRKISLCLSCAHFWKFQHDNDLKCYKGGSDGGLIDYCTGYEERKEEGQA